MITQLRNRKKSASLRITTVCPENIDPKFVVATNLTIKLLEFTCIHVKTDAISKIFAF